VERTNLILATLLILTIVFASISVLEYTMPGFERTTASTMISTTTTTVEVTQTPTSSSISLSLSAGCLLPVGAGAKITVYGEKNTTGVMVNSSSGQATFVPENQCPQPISNQTFAYSAGDGQKIPTNYYQLATDAVSNPRFTTLENGTTLLFSQPGSTPLSTTGVDNDAVYGDFNGSYDYSFSLFFFHYTDIFLTGPGCDTFSITAGIEADFFAPYYQQYVNGIPTQANWNLTAFAVHALPSDQVASEECASY
jgi:hypothetical protein